MARDGDQHRIDALLASLGQAPDEELAAASARDRSRRRWSRQLAAESSTLAGVLLALAEREATVTLRAGPWTHRGRLRTVTTSLCIVECSEGIALVATDAVTVVSSEVCVADDRVPGDGPDLAAVLAMLAAERPPVLLQLADGSEVGGTLIDLGKDVATLRIGSSVATVRLDAIAGCILIAQGNDVHPQ